MRRQIIILGAVVAAIDLLLPDVSTGAQVMIAPAIIAAIIGAVGTMVSAEQAKQGAQDAATAKAAAAKDQEGVMKPVFQEAANAKTGQLPATNPEEAAWRLEQGLMSGTIDAGSVAGRTPRPPVPPVPESKMAETVEKADKGQNVGNYPLTPEKAGKFGTGELLTPDFGDTPLKEPDTEGMSFDEKMQYAAIAAQLGSAIAGQGGPPPPGAPRGGGINMSPVFQQLTARGIYG